GQLLDALRIRDREATASWFQDMNTDDASYWLAMSSRRIIDVLFGQAISYYSKHPYALQLHDLSNDEAVDAFIRRLTEALVLRLGDALGSKAAQTLYAISTGTLSFLVDPKTAHSAT